MSKAYDFLKQNGPFYLATVNNDAPAVRPFGAVMEYNGMLYLATANMKEVYKQMKANPNVQLSCTKKGSMDWIRINGKALEKNDRESKQAMLDACPGLVRLFQSADNPVFTTFAITEMSGAIYANGKAEEL